MNYILNLTINTLKSTWISHTSFFFLSSFVFYESINFGITVLVIIYIRYGFDNQTHKPNGAGHLMIKTKHQYVVYCQCHMTDALFIFYFLFIYLFNFVLLKNKIHVKYTNIRGQSNLRECSQWWLSSKSSAVCFLMPSVIFSRTVTISEVHLKNLEFLTSYDVYWLFSCYLIPQKFFSHVLSCGNRILQNLDIITF